MSAEASNHPDPKFISPSMRSIITEKEPRYDTIRYVKKRGRYYWRWCHCIIELAEDYWIREGRVEKVGIASLHNFPWFDFRLLLRLYLLCLCWWQISNGQCTRCGKSPWFAGWCATEVSAFQGNPAGETVIWSTNPNLNLEADEKKKL